MAVRDDPSKHLPSGTVTLLFADIEGSTRLLAKLRADGFAPVRARLRELVRAAAAVRGGREVDWAGDGVFLAFPRATDAVLAAVELQRALDVEPWPPDGVVRLRIGIHTGEPDLGDEGYVGMDVVVAARICAASHGGQVVVSRATRDFVGDVLEGLSFRSLGSHRLKDVPGAEQLFQLVGEGLLEGFAPLHTLGGTALPALHHRLVGRRRDLSGTLSLLSRADVRLVTLTGPGGAGKSRLALEIAALTALERPVHLVGLAPVSDPEFVPVSIAHVLGVREGGRPLVDCIAEAVAGSGALLLLDNFEHLAPAAAHVAALLDHAPDLDVLVTSRAPLRLSAEHVVPLEPLPMHDAATLFSELAAARGVVLHDDSLPAIREICRRLDGLPLAIELVAARLAVLPPAQLLMALDEGLTLDMEGPVDLPERQRTLRATIDWSYGLLSESQRGLHQALAVFSGGCTLDDARALSGSTSFLSDLEGLVVGSLLRSDVSDGEVRLFMLETVREDALARLAVEGRLEDLRRRHAERFLELAASAEDGLAGPEQGTWFDRLERELDNIRAALDWCLTSGRAGDVLRAVSSLGRFWMAHGHVTEARGWLSHGLAVGEDVPPAVRAHALMTAAHQATAQSDWDTAGPLLEEAHELFDQSDHGRERVFALALRSWVYLMQDEVESARRLAHAALAVANDLGDDRASSLALMGLGDVHSAQGEHEHALARYGEAVELRTRMGDPLLMADAVYYVGMAAFRAGDLARARQEFEKALAPARELGEATHTAAAQFMLAEVDILEGESASARARAKESLALYSDLEDNRSRARCLVILAATAVAEGSYEAAARTLGAADAARGDDSPDEFERPLLDRCAPELAAALGEARVAALGAAAARVPIDDLVREVVGAGIEE
ncbi:MAG TPA: tetratricopeptide repeat protein [Gaiellaceae bacterium]|nr:tetratricopeptide repeat protein [Gaiellaceae bacterium]